MPLLDSLPGVEMPVSEVPGALRELWSQTEHSDISGTGIDQNYRAVQSNLILHFGLATGQEEARDILDQALEFAGLYPCRIICLCPADRAGEQLLRGKLYSQCLLSGGGGHPVCSEALMLGYSLEDSQFLEHQVSIWLESDLPTYHWFHRLPVDRIMECYMPFLKMVTRATYDSSLEGSDDLSGIQWPCPRGARDLADARLLHLRQGLGQALSSVHVEALLGGLGKVQTIHGPGLAGEARSLDKWISQCLGAAGKTDPITHSVQEDPNLEGLRCIWNYSRGLGKSLNLETSRDLCRGMLVADFGKGQQSFPLHLKKPTAAHALSEALFF